MGSVGLSGSVSGFSGLLFSGLLFSGGTVGSTGSVGSEVVVSSELSFSLTVPPLDDGFCETKEDELGFEEEPEDEDAAEEEFLLDEEPPWLEYLFAYLSLIHI